MIKKRTKILYAKLIVLTLCLFIVARIFNIVLSKYETEANSSADVDIAFYLFNEDFKTMELNLESLVPREEKYTYLFNIGNQDGEEVAEIDLEYNLTIRTTTNLPLTYELYMNGENIIKTNEIIQDEDGTYFRVITTDTQELKYREPKTNQYELVVYFSGKYNTINYQDIIELLEITVESKQATE